MKVNGTIWINWILKILINTTIFWFSFTLIVVRKKEKKSFTSSCARSAVAGKTLRDFCEKFFSLRQGSERESEIFVHSSCTVRYPDDDDKTWLLRSRDFSRLYHEFQPDHVLNNVGRFSLTLLVFCAPPPIDWSNGWRLGGIRMTTLRVSPKSPRKRRI